MVDYTKFDKYTSLGLTYRANFVSEDSVSVKFDIACFGSMMYEVTCGSRYEFYVVPEIEADLDDDPESKTFRRGQLLRNFQIRTMCSWGISSGDAGLGTDFSRCRKFVTPWIIPIKSQRP